MADTNLELIMQPMAAASPPAVDVVTVAYNSRETLRACVEPLAQLPWVSVTVVDNASPDDSAAVVADLPVRTIRAPRNGGFAYGCNLGAEAGQAEFVLLINPDASIDSRGLGKLVDALRADSDAGGRGTPDLGEGGRLQRTQGRFPRLRSTYSQAMGLHRLAPRAAWASELVKEPGAYARPTTPDWLSGGCVLLRGRRSKTSASWTKAFSSTRRRRTSSAASASRGWRPASSRRRPLTIKATGQRHARRPPRSWAEPGRAYARKHHGHSSPCWRRSAKGIDALVRAVPGSAIRRAVARSLRPRGPRWGRFARRAPRRRPRNTALSRPSRPGAREWVRTHRYRVSATTRSSASRCLGRPGRAKRRRDRRRAASSPCCRRASAISS